MALDLSAASLIRSGSGLLLLILGIAFAVLARRGVAHPRLAQGLALYGAGSGLAFLAVNLAGKDAVLAPSATLANILGWLAADAGLIIILVWLRPRKASLLAVVGIGLVSLTMWGTFALTLEPSLAEDANYWAPSAMPLIPLNVFAYQVGWTLALVVGFALAARYTTHSAERAGVALLAVGLILYPAMVQGSTVFNRLGDSGAGAPFATFALVAWISSAVALACLAIAWIRVISIEPRPARIVAPIALGSWLLGMLFGLPGMDSGDTVGYLRIAGVVVIVVALLRYDLLGAGLTTRSVRRGKIATGALATLFIVAQIAQNFLAAQYGLLMGGVVAGAFLFAAAPLQRAMERMGTERADHMPAPTPVAAAILVQEVRYRAALRLALRDRRLTRDEEIDLHHLADGLSISSGRAHELLVEVERDMGVR